MHHELTRRTFEDPLQHVPGKLLLGLLGGKACFIAVRPLCFVSAHRALCGHDLQKLEHSGVAEIFFLAERFVNFSDRLRSAAPEDAQDFKLRSGRFVGRLLHGKEHTTKVFVVSTKIFVDEKILLEFVYDCSRDPPGFAQAGQPRSLSLRDLAAHGEVVGFYY